MPRLLTFDQKLDLVTCTKDGLYPPELNPQAVRNHFVTVDETSTHTVETTGSRRKSALRRAKIVAEGKLWRVFYQNFPIHFSVAVIAALKELSFQFVQNSQTLQIQLL